MSKRSAEYDVHPGVRMVQDWIAGLKGKTGRTVDEWVALVKREGPKDDAGRQKWLKDEHGFGTNNAAWLVAQCNGGTPEDSPEGYLKAAAEYVEGQYAGKKEGLRQLYERLLAMGRGMGRDVRVCPCKTMVPLYRRYVFAQIKPTTNSRVDLGLALAAYEGKVPKRLIDTGGKEKKDRITHRIGIGAVGEIDGEVERWMRVAYGLDG